MKPATVHWADLLRATAGLAGQDRLQAQAALGYAPPPRPPRRRQQRSPQPAALADAPPPGAQPPALPIPPPAAELPRFWRVLADQLDPQATSDEPDWLVQRKGKPPPDGCFTHNGAGHLPATAPLLPPARLARLLRQQLAHLRNTDAPDLAGLVKRLACGLPVQALRPAQRLRWPAALALLRLDCGDLGTLGLDLRQIQAQIEHLLGQRARTFTSAGSLGHWRNAAGRPVAAPARHQATLVLGDPGLADATTPAAVVWHRWAAGLARAGRAPLWLAPLSAPEIDPRWCSVARIVPLDETARPVPLPARRPGPDLLAGPSTAAQPVAQRPAAQGALLGLLAGLSSVPPALLRRARRALRKLGLAGAGISAERAWLLQPEVVGSPLASRVLPEHNARAIAALVAAVPDPARLAALVTQVSIWVRGLSPLLQSEHWQALKAHLPPAVLQRLPVQAQDTRCADLWAWFAAQLAQPQADTPAALLRGYAQWLWQVSPDTLRLGPAQSRVAFALAWGQHHAPGQPLPDGLPAQDFAWLLPAGGPPLALHMAAVEAGQLSAQWRPPSAGPAPAPTGPCLAPALPGLPGVQQWAFEPLAPSTRPGDAQAASADLRHHPASAPASFSPGQRWRLHLGPRRVDLDAIAPPPWASSLWRDGEALYATLAGGRRLRWVPRQAFDIADQPTLTVVHARYTLPHGAWWDDDEFQGLMGTDGRWHRPGWANAGHGLDQHGWWSAFDVGGATQVMRFVPPGGFTMGSPPGEPGRSDNEVQHPVLLSRGFWLADTACSQALYRAATGSNPSHFADDPQGPVERVSWDDVHRILLPALAAALPGLAARLPTEAEWEYAAREAGRATLSFPWGDRVTPQQANFNGNYPLPGGRKGMNRERTLPVKHFEPNALGLWQMHGNVLEWVQDPLQDYLQEQVVDPGEGSAGTAARRVLRGGSWIYGARYCRSAMRFHLVPGERYHYIGFRLARGLPQAPAGRAEPAGVRSSGGPQASPPGADAPAAAARQRGRRAL